MVWTFFQIFTCMLSRQTLKLGYLDTTYVFSGEVETLSCYRSDAMIMKFLSEQFVLKLCQMDNLCQSWGKLKLLLMKINFTFPGGQKLRIFGSSWNFLTSQFWNLEHFFWNFVRIIICKKSPQYLTFMHFKASDSVVPIQPGDTSDVEETSYFTAGFAFHKMFKSVARFVNAATKTTRDKVGIDCILWRVWNFVMSLVWYNDHRTFVRIFFSETLAERVFPRILDVHKTL